MRAAALALTLCLALAGGAVATSPPPGGGTSLSYPKAGLTLPRSIGGLPMVSQKDSNGDGLDNVIRYEASGIWATIYLYRPPLADPNLLALVLEKILREKHGAALTVQDDRLVAVAGSRPNARRVVYAGVDGGKLASALVVARTGEWLVKVRVSGPATRQAEVLSVADAVLPAIGWGKAGGPDPLAPWKPVPCLTEPTGAAPAELEVKGKLADMANGLNAKPFRGIAWPADGKGVCVDKPVRIGEDTRMVLRGPVGEGAYHTRFLILMDDAGTLVEVGQAKGEGRTLGVVRQHNTTGSALVGWLEMVPTRPQLEPVFGLQ
ncbi:hypothetical protein HHL28_10615 [Aerophototrophica crusticola]|uniref:Uncharacterized protein n=1 Tax=Aerophototrophica crusticola TaxID=1709002 RepID=A0A858R7T7_9PROT|nr:hypothetical protein HHL28_10615 [Rhodospirillaceae bacterium B3]